MNSNIGKLYKIGTKSERFILGLMSGTSLDGLDLALCKISGSGRKTQLDLLAFKSVPYETEYVERVQKVFSKEIVQLADVSGLNSWIARLHAEMVLETLKSWNISPHSVDLIASHGQTIYHGPQSLKGVHYPNHTLQIGDGDHLAVLTGILTCSDFRQKHIAAGGEGAPLVVYGDFLLFSDPDEDRILLNLGGIANFTYLPSQASKAKGNFVQASDLGPANTLINQYMKKHFSLEMDANAKLSSTGSLQQKLLTCLLGHDFFTWSFPKTTGPELFNLEFLEKSIFQTKQDFRHEDVLFTLTQMSVEGVIQGVEGILEKIDQKVSVYISGGGAHNPLMMSLLKARLGGLVEWKSFDDLGIPGDAKEAALFAVLANESVAGNGDYDGQLQNLPLVGMGKISFPT